MATAALFTTINPSSWGVGASDIPTTTFDMLNTINTWCGYGTAGYSANHNWGGCFWFGIPNTLGTAAHVFSGVLRVGTRPGYSGWFKFGAGNYLATRFTSWNNTCSGYTYRGNAFVNSGSTTDCPMTSDIQYRIDNAIDLGFVVDKYDSNYFQYFTGYLGSAGGSPTTLRITWGYKVTGASAVGGTRNVGASWATASNPGTRVRLYKVGTGLVSTVDVGGSPYVWNNLTSGQYYYTANNIYDAGETSGATSGTVTVDTGGSSTVSAVQGDTPIRKRIRATNPGYDNGASSRDYRVVDGASNQLVITTGQTASTVDLNIESQPAGTYYVQTRNRWPDGDVSAWSGNVAAAITTPTIGSDFVGTTTQLRQVTLTWNRLTDAATYTVTMDGTARTVTGVVNTPGSTGAGTNFTYSVDAATVTFIFTNVKSGVHSFGATPVYTNGYTGSVIAGTTTGSAQIPTPSTPTGIANSPSKRQIACTSGNGTPASWFAAQDWQFRRSTIDASIITTTVATGTLSNVPKGDHVIYVRARWADGDVSPWIASATITGIQSPQPTGLIGRQKGAENTPATPTQATTGGTLAPGTYYVSTSVSKQANKTYDAAHPTWPTQFAVNETTPSVPKTVVVPAGTSTNTITVARPANAVSGDTWNVYIGTDRNSLYRAKNGATILENRTFATTTAVITTYTVEAIQAKFGKVDLLWVAPTGVGDAPTSYQVERAAAVPPNSSTGTPGQYNSLQTKIANGQAGLYGTNLKFWEQGVDTKYYYYRVSAVYTNDNASTDISDPVEVAF